MQDNVTGVCLVTGASGFIGSHYVQRSGADNPLKLRALVRKPRTAQTMGSPRTDVVEGDLLRPGSIVQALQGCRTVVHLAHGDRGPEATHNLVEACCRGDIERFVHVSSVAVHGPSPGPGATDEATAAIGRYDDEYCNSKAEQEEIVRRAMDTAGLPAVILRPTVVYGPSSHFVKQVLAEARTGVVTIFDHGEGVCNAVYVDDVCDAIDAAMFGSDVVGEALFVNGDHAVRWGEFIGAFANFVRPLPEVRNLSSAEALNWWAAHPPSAPPSSLFQRVVRKAARMTATPPEPPPFPPRGRVMRETIRVEFSNTKAKRLLAWSPRFNWSSGVAATHDWFRAEHARAVP